MMMEKLLNIALEIATLSALAMGYYFWQRHRILSGPKNWRRDKLLEIYQCGQNCLNPEDYPALNNFLGAIETKLKSDKPLIDEEFLKQWKNSKLPQDILETLSDCSEWETQSQPNTR